MEPQDYSGGSVDADIDLYDEDRVALNRVLRALQGNIGQRRNLEAFRQEVIERFGEVGFKVKVVLYEAENEATGEKFVHPQITITDRVEVDPDGFDHDRQAYQVQTNILGVDQPEVSRPIQVSMAGARKHGEKKTASGLILPG